MTTTTTTTTRPILLLPLPPPPPPPPSSQPLKITVITGGSKQFDKMVASLLHMDGSIIFTKLHQCAPQCNTCFLGLTRVHNSNGITIGSAIFAQLMAERRWACPCMYFPLKTAHSLGAIWTPIQYMVPWANPSPNPKRHLDQFSRFSTAHGRELLYFTMGRSFSPLKIAPSNGGSLPPCNIWFPGSTRILDSNSIQGGHEVGEKNSPSFPGFSRVITILFQR